MPGRGSGRRPHEVAVIEGAHGYIRGLWSDALQGMRTNRSQRRNVESEAPNLAGYHHRIARRHRREAPPNPNEPDGELAEQRRSLGYAE